MIDRLSAALASHYRIERELGHGGMATVYLAHDVKHDRHVAVKVLRPELAAVLGADRFVQEIRTTASLQHPHILPLFDSGSADGFLYYVMPYVEGETLRSRLSRETQLGVEEAVRITCEVCDALDYAHRHGVIHRDIKPENILLQDGRPMVADFGIALAVSAAAGGRMTETGLSLGTPHYMSPEQATAEKEISARSDVYSLASVLYEMLSGSPPHVGASAQQIIMKIVTEVAAPVTNLRRSVPRHVAAAVGKALEKLQADRFATAGEFAAALRNPSFEVTSGAAAAASRPARGPVLLVALGAVATVALALAAWTLTQHRPGPPVTRLSVFLPPAQAFAGAGTFDLSRDGSIMVYEGPTEAGGSQLWVRRWDALTASPIRESEGATGPAISPDGREVAFARGGAIRIVPLEGGVSRTVGVQTIRCCVRWSADGAWLYFDHGEVGVGRVPAAGGEVEILLRSRDWSGTQVSVYMDPLPNGRGIVFEGTKAVGGPWIMALDLKTRERKDVTPGQFPRYASGFLFYVTVDGTTLMAAPFDQDALAFRSPPLPVGEGLRAAAGGWNFVAASQTGRLLYVVGGRATGQYEIVNVSRSGQVASVDSTWRFDPGDNNRGLTLSPDGDRLAVTVLEEGNYDIWVKQLPRGPASRLTFDPGQDVRPRWSPDGKSVIFLSDRGGRATSVYTTSATGTGGADLLLQDAQRPFWEAAWSPDGQWLLARTGGLATVAGGRDMWAMRQGKDTVASPLIVTDFDEKAIALSPDGRWLAYESDETGRNEVYVRPFPNVSEGKWQVSTGGGVMPRWARSGRELFYVNADNALVAALVAPGPAFSVGDRRALFPMPGGVLFRQEEQYALYDVLPNDRGFVMFRAVRRPDRAVTQPELILVEQWDRPHRGEARQ